MSQISKADFYTGNDKPVKASALKVGHKSFSFGTVTEVKRVDGHVRVLFDSRTLRVFRPDETVK